MRRHFEVARPGGKTHTLFLAVGTWWFFLLFFLFFCPGAWGVSGVWFFRVCGLFVGACFSVTCG